MAEFDEMGLGKSWVACARIKEDGESGRDGGAVLRTLLVVPACILSQWDELVARFGIADRVRIVSYASIGRRTKTYAEVMGVAWHRVSWTRRTTSGSTRQTATETSRDRGGPARAAQSGRRTGSP